MKEVIGYKCLICGARLHDVGEHRELTGHDDYSPIYDVEPNNKTDESTLQSNEYHPSADSAMEWFREWKKDVRRYALTREAISSTALSGNRLAQVLNGTLDRLEKGEPVSDRYLLGLTWFLLNDNPII